MDTFHSKFAGKGFSASSLNSATESELASLERDLMTASPAALAMTTSHGKWQAARHLMWLDRALLAAIDDASAGHLDGLVVCMPPQHGKSELCSKYLPAWSLGTFPDRRVVLTGYEADFAAQWGRKARDLLAEWGGVFGVRVLRRRRRCIALGPGRARRGDGHGRSRRPDHRQRGATTHRRRSDQERQRGPQRVSSAEAVRLVAIDGQHAAAARRIDTGHSNPLKSRRSGRTDIKRGHDEWAKVA